MKHTWLKSTEMALGIMRWGQGQARDTIENFMRDLRSLRALWNWIYMALYVFLCCWGAVNYPKETLTTAIVTTGGIVSWIFSNYIVSAYMDKKLTGQVPGLGSSANGNGKPPVPPANGTQGSQGEQDNG